MTVQDFLDLVEATTYKPGEEIRVLNPPDKHYPYDHEHSVPGLWQHPDSG